MPLPLPGRDDAQEHLAGERTASLLGEDCRGRASGQRFKTKPRTIAGSARVSMGFEM